MSLSAYLRKRDFRKTSEPKGRLIRGGGKHRSFVIQKHDATRLHYDFRLELGGTLKSWAVPKGIPFKKGEKHLAVHVEDHPLDYATFEGVIPKGQYGGGSVMVWDSGTYEALSAHPQKDLASGKLHFRLHGKKLEGEWTLARMRGDEAKEQWLLIKSGEDTKTISARKDDSSAQTGRTMAQIAAGKKPAQNTRSATPKAAKKNGEKPHFVHAMKATLREAPPTDGEWAYEIKFDGYRAVATKNGNDVELHSLNGKDFAARFPDVAAAIAKLPDEQLTLDGEIVALDETGRSSFSLLQNASGHQAPIAFYIFDLLHRNGENLTRLPLEKRRTTLERVLRGIEDPLRFSGEIAGDPQKLLDAVCQRGLEGVIGKRTDSAYEPGVRSRSWIKLKCLGQQELVIGGFTPPAGSRKHFGALLVGYFEKGKLKFAGKVGTGFDHSTLKDIYGRMTKLQVEDCPFANLPEKTAGRWSQNITPAEMRRCYWVKPELVCAVKFTEWTPDGKLRHPVFLGLREDKSARAVTRERPSAR